MAKLWVSFIICKFCIKSCSRNIVKNIDVHLAPTADSVRE
jgi:hypothetical protein